MTHEIISPDLLTEIKYPYSSNTEHDLLTRAFIDYVVSGGATGLLLKDDHYAKLWAKLRDSAQKRLDTKKRLISSYQIKIAAYNKLTADDRKILGIKKPSKPKGYVE